MTDYSCPEEAEYMVQEEAAQEAEGDAAYAAQCEAEEQARQAFEEIERQQPRIVIYTTTTCPRCADLKVWLSAQGIAYESKHLEDVQVITDLRLDSVFPREAPVLYADGYYMLSHHLFSSDGRLRESAVKAILEEP